MITDWNPRVEDERVLWPEFDRAGWEVWIRREDRIHPLISGNKFRKLKYNIRQARDLGCDILLTLGGAYSNHILAVAALAADQGIRSMGWIRGEELGPKSNESLRQASQLGMQLSFLSRGLYKCLRGGSWKGPSSDGLVDAKYVREWTQLLDSLPEPLSGVYYLPEGGTNELAVLGCAEILTPEDAKFDRVCCPVGTGGTVAGLIRSSLSHQYIHGFSAIKGTGDLKAVISKFTEKSNWEITDAYVQGGYGKLSEDLIGFMNRFRERGNCLLDPVYTGKMLYGLHCLAGDRVWGPGVRVLAIHTGGIQGIRGINQKRKSMGLPLIHTE